MKILVGVDDSAYSQAALEWVAQIRWPSGSECVVVSAVQQPVATAVKRARAGAETVRP